MEIMDTPFAASSNNIYIRPAHRGKHKIFIGMAPGVGKTYRMLEEAGRLKQNGIDVVIGFLETHNRPETAAKAEGLEVIPRKTVEQGGFIFTEMDIDAILERKPQLVLIDELAHIKVSESQQIGHYQDVEVILAAGIDVYSTVNIQHLESLSHLVNEITGIVVHERIPDNLLEAADEVVVVDVTPETLQERLLDGKIYPSKTIKRSLQNLFQRSNLVALREIALRQVADKIEQQGICQATQVNNNREDSTEQVFSVHERILVCVSGEPTSIRLIQRGATLANYMNAPLYVLFVYEPAFSLPKEEASHIQKCDRLCQELKCEFLQVPGYKIAEEIIKVANSYRITQVVLGQSSRSKWQTLLHGSLINQLVRSLTHIDIHIISNHSNY